MHTQQYITRQYITQQYVTQQYITQQYVTHITMHTQQYITQQYITQQYVISQCIHNNTYIMHGTCVGENAGAGNIVFFSSEEPYAGDEGYLLCAAGAARIVLTCDWLLQCVLQRAIVRLWVVTAYFGICGGTSQCNGCMNVAMFCCHVRRFMRVCNSSSHCNGCIKKVFCASRLQYWSVSRFSQFWRWRSFF